MQHKIRTQFKQLISLTSSVWIPGCILSVLKEMWQWHNKKGRDVASADAGDGSCCPQQLDAVLGLSAADSSTARPEWIKPRGKSRPAQHNMIKILHVFFQKVRLNMYYSNNNKKFGFYCLCQQMDQSKWDLSPYRYLNKDRSVKHFPSKRFVIPTKNRKILISPQYVFILNHLIYTCFCKLWHYLCLFDHTQNISL